MPVGHFRLTPTRAHRFWTWAPRVGGRDATSKWFESASWISFAGINDPETAECVSRRCGATTVEVDQLSRSLQSRGSSRTRSKQIAARPLIQPDEVLRMPADEQIAFTAGLRLRCGRAIWFRRDDMRGCVKQNSSHAPPRAHLIHHNHESIRPDRFKTLVGRDSGHRRCCSHAQSALPSLCRTNRRKQEHGPVLCPVDRADAVWTGLPDAALGKDRSKGPIDGPSLRQRARGGRLVSRCSQEEAHPGISAGGKTPLEVTCPPHAARTDAAANGGRNRLGEPREVAPGPSCLSPCWSGTRSAGSRLRLRFPQASRRSERGGSGRLA